MRASRPAIIGLSALALAAMALPSRAATDEATISREQASDKVLANGFSLVSKTEPTPGAWAVWASKDGTSYVLKVDARTGLVLKEVPLDDDD